MDVIKNQSLTANFKLLIVALLVLAGTIRFGYFHSESLWPDESLYAWAGKRVFENPSLLFSQEVSSYHPPLFAGLLAAGQLVMPSEAACRFVIFVFYLAGIVLIYHLGALIKNRFVGLVAAILLAFNEQYFTTSTRILLDVPLTVFTLLFAARMFKYARNDAPIKGIKVGLAACANVLVKWTGVLVLPWMVAYYLLIGRVTNVFIPATVIGVTVLALLINNYVQTQGITPDGGSIGTHHLSAVWPTVQTFLKLIGSAFHVQAMFLLFGLWAVFKEREIVKYLLYSWLVVLSIGISLVGVNLELRYCLPVLPCFLIIMAIGLDYVAGRLKMVSATYLVAALVLVYGLANFYGYKDDIQRNEQSFTHYKEAGAIIREAADDDTLVIAISHRQSRYYSGINYVEYGGQLLPFFKQTKEDFTNIVNNHKGDILLESDVWAPQKTDWFLNAHTDGVLQGLGFVKMHEIVADNKPVVTIFKRD